VPAALARSAQFANLKVHFATSSWGGRRKLPLAFTEHGAIMAATILNSPRAVEMSVYVVRVFVKLRELLVSNKDLARKLEALERSLVTLDLKTQRQFKEVDQVIRALMSPPLPLRRSSLAMSTVVRITLLQRPQQLPQWRRVAQAQVVPLAAVPPATAPPAAPAMPCTTVFGMQDPGFPCGC
jgi:hypothetical protein